MKKKQYVTGPQLQSRFGVSAMTLWRWLRDEKLGFPAPIRIRERNYWLEESVEAWERRMAAQAARVREVR